MDREVQVKRVVASWAARTPTTFEWSIVVTRQVAIAATDRDDEDKVVKTGYAEGQNCDVYQDFITTIRLRKGDTIGLIVENRTGAVFNGISTALRRIVPGFRLPAVRPV